ncbi:LPS export ABC transporter periplasmic protein LptC [Sulfurimonas sp. HSL-1716]|uniref:LPS export ABC transporter periplasmic protein LptC n=1 Tax=Hydrocurvibacter sulfurireducens TaxID=3131937 RepID=UPI0031FA073B
MNINFYFIYISVGLAMIYLFFHPMKMEKLDKGEIAQLELTKFTIYDLDKEGLKSIFQGTKGYRYLDRYEIFDVNYTDNSKEQIANITSNFGIYKDYIVDLYGNLIYKRADGLTYKSDDGNYNQRTGVLKTKSKYISYRNNDRITGNSLMYDSKHGHATSKDVSAVYQLKNSEKL